MVDQIEGLPFRQIFENNHNGMVITDTNGCIKWINSAFTEITGYSMEEVVNKNPRILKSGVHESNFYENMWKQLKSQGTWGGEIWNRNKEGNIYSEWLDIKSLDNDFGSNTYYVGVFKDLTQKKKIDRRMAELQQKDLLTGLYNRNYFLQIIDDLISDNKDLSNEFSIIVIGIEEFDDINDSLGHITGDEILIQLSNRIASLMNDNCTLARVNHDEFAIICKCVKKENINHLAQVLINKIKEPFKIENAIIHINVNIGISMFPEDGDDQETLVRYAHIASNKAKKYCQDRICFYSREMSRKIEERFYIANFLFNAIPNKELTINYQPLFDINEKILVGAEALLRWENPILGKVPPDKFIGIAEKTGQIITIGMWVIEEVCKQINIWKHKGYKPIPIAINISVKQLEQDKFSKTVLDILERNKIHPKNIELEITESVSFGDVQTIVKNLIELKERGFKISMDDFGTGFSSFGQLNIFEIDKLKIDKIFVDDLVDDQKSENLVKAMISMGKGMNLTVAAEGIENLEQLWKLEELGCELGQGYWFSKPLSPEEIDSFLKSNNSLHIGASY